jgi:hypothetical protein
MSHQPSLPHGVMEGQGAYNKYAKLPAAGGSLALPLWEKVVEGAEVDPGDRTVVVADYGSSQGKNSMAPMSIARKTLRGRLGPDRPISFFHIDQPSNDFQADNVGRFHAQNTITFAT